MQATFTYVIGTGDTYSSMDKIGHWYLPLWGRIILTAGGLHKLIPNCMPAELYDGTTCHKSL